MRAKDSNNKPLAADQTQQIIINLKEEHAIGAEIHKSQNN